MRVAEQSIEAFLSGVASGAVTPSGGAAAALGGALGAALGEMVCLHTVGKAGYEDIEAELTELGDALADHRRRLLELADEDVAAVDRVQSTFESSSATDRREAMTQATAVPLETAEVCLDVLEGVLVAVEKGNERATADGLVGAFLAHAALRASTATVRANLETLEDETFVSETNARVHELDERARDALERVETVARFDGRE